MCCAALTFPVQPQARAEPFGQDAPETCSVQALRRIKRKKMSMKQVVKLCGEPQRDIGSGIHIYVYELADGSAVWVGTPDRKRIIYVTHVLPGGERRGLFRRG